jgi:hypothetical protein
LKPAIVVSRQPKPVPLPSRRALVIDLSRTPRHAFNRSAVTTFIARIPDIASRDMTRATPRHPVPGKCGGWGRLGRSVAGNRSWLLDGLVIVLVPSTRARGSVHVLAKAPSLSLIFEMRSLVLLGSASVLSVLTPRFGFRSQSREPGSSGVSSMAGLKSSEPPRCDSGAL